MLVYRPEGRLVAVECLAHPFFEVQFARDSYRERACHVSIFEAAPRRRLGCKRNQGLSRAKPETYLALGPAGSSLAR